MTTATTQQTYTIEFDGAVEKTFTALDNATANAEFNRFVEGAYDADVCGALELRAPDGEVLQSVTLY